MDIALVAATITAYSIATSLLSFEVALRRQAKSPEKEVDQKLTSGEIKHYTDAEKEIRRIQEKKEEAATLRSGLSLLRIVVVPDLCFFLSIAVAIWGILVYPVVAPQPSVQFPSIPAQPYWQSSALALILGVILLFAALSWIEYSRRTAISVLREATD